MKESLLTTLRKKDTTLTEFRNASHKLSFLIASKTAEKIKQKTISIQTSLAPTNGSSISQNIIFVPILRAGLALLPAFMYYFDMAKVGFLGIQRDDKTYKPHLYYENLPKISKEEKIFLLDPMIATGNTAIKAIEQLIQAHAHQSHITLVSIVASPQGMQAIESKYPDISIDVVSVDEKLNDHNYIVPGLGDFGDRFYGTEQQQ